MVQQATIVNIIVSLVVSVVAPVALLVYLRKKYHISYRQVAIGAAMWFLFSQLLEPISHGLVLQNTGIQNSPWLFAVYAALAAGVFEGLGRYVGFSYFFKPDQRQFQNGLAYGAGHGGVESLLVGSLAMFSLLVLALLMNSGREAELAGRLPQEVYGPLKSALLGPSSFFLLAGIERVFALVFHLALSLVILLGVRRDRIQLVLLAILLHALLDFPAALYQAKLAGIWTVEIAAAASSAVLLVAIVKLRKLFNDNA